jgi:hypothetical protein
MHSARKLLTFFGAVLGLLTMLKSSALANFLQTPTATVTCSGYSISVQACQLTAGQNYTIDYSIVISPESGPPSELSNMINFTAGSTTNGTPGCPNNTFSDTISGGPTPPFPLPPGTYTFSGNAALDSFSSTGINFSPSSLTCPAPVCTAGISISGSMEGNLPVSPGDTVKAGFDFTIPGSHAADTVSFSNVSVVLPVQCPDGTTDTLTIPIPNQSITVPVNNSNWFPSGDQQSPLVYQGSIIAPANLCGGEEGHAPQGATFAANLSASTDNSVNVRFHYSDNTSGSWSGTNSYCQ